MLWVWQRDGGEELVRWDTREEESRGVIRREEEARGVTKREEEEASGVIRRWRRSEE